MKRVRIILNRLLQPPGWLLRTLPPLAFGACALELIAGTKDSMLAYITYGMSAYCLTICVLTLPRLLRKARAAIVRQLSRTEFGRSYVEDPAFRGRVSICRRMTVNFLHVVFRIFVGIRYASVWSITIAVYDLLLGLMRLSLILGHRSRTVESELRCYRRTAWLLFALNIPMGGMILLMVLTDSGYSYPGYVIYLSALYTFYAVIFSVISLVRFRKSGSPILSAAKLLRLVAALTSLLGLQTAMIAQFSGNAEVFRSRMNAVTGGGVWFAVILIAVYMLMRSRKMKGVRAVDPLRE